MENNDDIREVQITDELNVRMIEDSLALPFGATYDVFVSDFKEFYTKEQVMYEYGLIKGLEAKYKDNPKYQEWKKALIDVMAWYNTDRLI